MVLTSPPAPHPPAEAAAVVDAYEETHVHGVYEAIASHFSATRHKPWPLVTSFLASQPAGSVGLDVGCGNGKNMGVNGDVLMLGCDRSAALVALARDSVCRGRGRGRAPAAAAAAAAGGGGAGASRGDEDDDDDDHSNKEKKTVVVVDSHHDHGTKVVQGADVAVADSLALPFREGGADFAICIAVIHHLSTRERRVDAIRQLLRCIRRRRQQQQREDDSGDGADGQDGGGRVLVYVWALEQSNSRRGWDEGGEQDLLVPWVMKAPPQKKEKKKAKVPKAKGQKKGRKQEQGQGQGQGQGQSQGQGPELAGNKRDQGEAAAAAAEPNGAGDAGGTTSDRPRGGGGEGGEDLQAEERQQSQQQQQQQQQQQSQPLQQQDRREADADAAATAAAVTAENDGGADNNDDNNKGDDNSNASKQQHADKTFHRYYHLYRKGELEDEVVAAGGRVISSGYERDNWWVIAG